MDVLWLEDAACADSTTVGGKAATLARLATGYLVPPGFCLPATALVGVRPSAAEAFPAGLAQSLAGAYRALGQRCGRDAPAVAVRSSAIGEDGQLLSFAGQHESFLNVTGVAAVAAAVRDCLASAHSQRALAYRERHRLTPDAPSMAVLVQEFVDAEASAIAFSVNPVTSSPAEVLISACWGLGESLANGSITPDTFTVMRSDLSIVRRDLGDKDSMAAPAPGGGTEQKSVSRELQDRLALSDPQAKEVAALTLKLERSLGWPVDVECAYHRGVLYLLQCRPITALR